MFEVSFADNTVLEMHTTVDPLERDGRHLGGVPQMRISVSNAVAW
jgi:hypothetical protein